MCLLTYASEIPLANSELPETFGKFSKLPEISKVFLLLEI